ncbi:MAG: hypothetical protein AAB038_02055 [Planctomycetota bacterium]
MGKFRSTKVTEFLDAAISTPDILEEYFRKYHITLNLKESTAPFSTVIAYLDNLTDTDLKDTIEEEIARLYDIAKTMTGFIPDVIQKYHIASTGKENQHQLILGIFLKSKPAYNHLSDYYLLYGSGNKLSRHKMECTSFTITPGKMEQFKAQIKAWFKDRRQGKDCIIRHYEENGKLIIAVIRGKNKKHQLVLKDEDKEVNTETIIFRPAYEDILQYDGKTSFSVHTSLRKDREKYIDVFADIIICDKSQAMRPDRDDTYILKPLQEDDFSFPVNETIRSVKLTAVTMVLNGSTKPTIRIDSTDINQTFNNDIAGLGIDSGELTSAKFLFILQVNGKAIEVSFEITPPSSTDLGSKKYNEIINKYLEDIGIKENDKVPFKADREKP